MLLRAATESPAVAVGGYTPLTTIDYPGRLAAVVFCRACPWRCGYCHNPHLQTRGGSGDVPWPRLEAFLERRRGLLDAVVFSGGEPTVQRGLEDAMRRVRAMGFGRALHTAGADPRRLARVLPLVDWVALDVKASFADYERITGVAGSGRKARESALAVLRWGGPHEMRTTVHPAQWTEDALWSLARELADLGARHYALQRFRPEGCADARLLKEAAPGFPSPELCARIGGLFESFVMR